MRAAAISTSITLACVLAACGGESEDTDGNEADRVFLDGAVYTVDTERSWAEAVAILYSEILIPKN